MKEELKEKIESKIDERKTANDIKVAFVKEVNQDIANKAEENLDKLKAKTEDDLNKIKANLDERKTVNDIKVAFVKEVNQDIANKVEENLSELKSKIENKIEEKLK